MESLEIEPEEGAITLRLHAKPGEEIDPGEIERCLDHTVARSGGDDPAER